MAVFPSRKIVVPKYSWLKYTISVTQKITNYGSDTVSCIPGAIIYYQNTKPSANGDYFNFLSNTTPSHYINIFSSNSYFGNNTRKEWRHAVSYSGYSGDKYVFECDSGQRITPTNTKGDLIGKVYSNEKNAYPDDGIYNGYWYVREVS